MPYIGNQLGTGVRSRFIYTATASQTTFTGADNNGKTLKYADSDYIDVFLNGVCLVPGTDYTASTKTSVVLGTGASASDTLEVVAYDIASIADTVSKADGGTFNGDLGITNSSPDITLTNNTTEDTDGGRESTVTFKGLQSGGEESTLAQIQASHDATADDQKGDLIFKTNDGSDNAAPTEAVRISSNQRVGISETDPQQNLHITSSTGAAIRLARNDTSLGTGDVHGSIEFHQNDPSENGAGVVSKIQSINESTFAGHGSIAISTGTATTIAERWRFTSDGHLKAAANGNGIDFSATEGSSASSSILDDYEEGTFSPTITGSSGSSGQSYTSSLGYYTKVGNMVTFWFHVQLSNEGTHSGPNVVLGNLPYTLGSGSGVGGGSINFASNLGVNVFGSLVLNAYPSTTSMYINYGDSDGPDPISNSVNAIGNTTRLDGFGSYKIA